MFPNRNRFAPAVTDPLGRGLVLLRVWTLERKLQALAPLPSLYCALDTFSTALRGRGDRGFPKIRLPGPWCELGAIPILVKDSEKRPYPRLFVLASSKLRSGHRQAIHTSQQRNLKFKLSVIHTLLEQVQGAQVCLTILPQSERMLFKLELSPGNMGCCAAYYASELEIHSLFGGERVYYKTPPTEVS